MTAKTETIRAGVEKVKISANPDNLITKMFLWSNLENEYPHFVFLSTNKKVTGVWNSEVGSRKSMEKAKDIQFHPWNTTYIYTAVKIQFLIFSQLWNTAFLKYALYLINIFLYFITLYIIKKFYFFFRESLSIKQKEIITQLLWCLISIQLMVLSPWVKTLLLIHKIFMRYVYS